MTTTTKPDKTGKQPQKVNSIHLLTVGRRAHMGQLLCDKKTEALTKLSTAKSFDLSVRNARFGCQSEEFHNQILLMGVCGILENFLTDITVEFLTCYPGALESKVFSLETLANAGSVSALLEEMAEKEINALSYKSFPEMLKCFEKIFSFKKSLDEKLINDLNEIKCTRDVYIHSDGKANTVYLRKTGEFGRVRIGEKLPLGKDYLADAIVKTTALIEEFFAGGPANYSKFGRVKAFKEMWEATCLSKVIAFDEAWIDGGPIVKGGEHIVRPTQKAKDWGWSHSEKALYNFFFKIYGGPGCPTSTDTIEALVRFPPSTPEGLIIISWMHSPFVF